jgi:predicted  nucleic acid-binding Zn-ribbon protein
MTSEQVLELRTEFSTSLERLCALVENRSAWSDAIAGCREALVMLTDAADKLKAIHEGTQQLESDLAAARAENATWGKNHSELSVVERILRAQCESGKTELKQAKAEAERFRKKHSTASTAEKELRAELDQYREALEQRSTELAVEVERSKERRATWSQVEQELRAELERQRASLEQRGAALANARSLSQRLVSEISV